MRNPYFINMVLSSILLVLCLFNLFSYTAPDTCTVCPICNPEVKAAYLEEQAEQEELNSMGYMWYSLGYGNRDE